jgi:SPP1 family predicted phage head-tail adaptor
MMWRDVVELIDQQASTNDIGDQVFAETSTTVFANKKSVRQSEFYQAFAHGLKPELMFEIRSIEYRNQPSLRYNSKEYTIIRAYSKNDEVTELVVSGIVPKGAM